MKLLHCNDCSDVFSLRYEKRTCICGKSGGHYLEDGLHAVIWGECIALGFANDSFVTAIKDRPMSGRGKEFTAFVIPKYCDTVWYMDNDMLRASQQVKTLFDELDKLIDELKDHKIDVHGADNE